MIKDFFINPRQPNINNIRYKYLMDETSRIPKPRDYGEKGQTHICNIYTRRKTMTPSYCKQLKRHDEAKIYCKKQSRQEIAKKELSY